MVPETAKVRHRREAPGSPVNMTEEAGHGAFVDAWLEHSAAKGLPREGLVDLFEAALHALWARTSTTLGEVTLTAIADRVLHNAAERLPAFASLRVDPNGRIHASELRQTVASLHHLKLLEGMRFVLVEFLTVLGNLTDELLTAELHEELRQASRDGNGRPVAARSTRAASRPKNKDDS